MVEPSFKMLWAEELPQNTADGVEIALIAGALPGLATPPTPPPDSYAQPACGSDLMVVTIKLAAGAKYTLPAFSGGNVADGARPLHRNVYFYAGASISVGGKALKAHAKVKVVPDVDLVLAADAAGPAEVLVLQGRDIGEPTVQHGPFVGNTQQDIMRAFQDYQTTGFGGVRLRPPRVATRCSHAPCAARDASPCRPRGREAHSHAARGYRALARTRWQWPWESDALAFGRERQRFAKYADGRLEERPLPADACPSK